ncbi:iron ABC transporter permease [Siculibacillus lacustris]|uniref:Iron ABC transporter permease n=1 Tax=Siculibacillus lacustris TaxID=1549641 RepID=A0A4Q9VMG8_9HYPH|nr:iron ABC transporter permease [Siculibacillus lacustris]TBW36760.1 iron ABC transporter permease [Siculibacillus lacustris]
MIRPPPFPVLILGLSALTLALFAASLLTGPSDIRPWRGLTALFVDDGAISLVMREIRLPRAILGVAIGASLGLSGAVLQGWLRNPLADAGVLGIGSSAALGAVVAIASGLASAFPPALPLAALLGAMAAVVIVLILGGRDGNRDTLILAGVAVSSITAALTSLALNLSANPFATLEIVFWMLGSLVDRSLAHVALALPFMVLGWVLIGLTGRSLDALTLGAETAASLGVRLDRVRLCIVLGTAAAVGAATAVAGVIGFVGLVSPHLLRPLVGGRPSRLLPASALGGAAMLAAADLAARLIAPDRDLKLGVVTAMIGAPFFLWLVFHERGRAP